MTITLPEGIFALSKRSIPSFHPSVTVVSCFIEWKDQILVLKRAASDSFPHLWCTPGGVCESNERVEEAVLREVWEETHIPIAPIEPIGTCFIRSQVSLMDYRLAIFCTHLHTEPSIELNFEEHQESKWIAKEDFCALNLIPFLKEIFLFVYQPLTLKEDYFGREL